MNLWVPDFRNFGVLVRILILAELVSFVSLLVGAASFQGAWSSYADWGRLYEPSLMLVLLLLALLAPMLSRLHYQMGVACVLGVAAAGAGGLAGGLAQLTGGNAWAAGARAAVLGVSVAALILAYFNWRAMSLAPSHTEARLAALRARMRPHFLFNSLNTVVALVHSNPDVAETILLNLSDLFRAALSEERALVPLSQEIELGQAYLMIEGIRLGERLRVRWELSGAPGQAKVPQLLLQPLLENAVRHGVEPMPEGGEIGVAVKAEGKRLVLEVSNPVDAVRKPSGGNQMALRNIEERLALHYDEEASLRRSEKDGRFSVEIRLPVVV